MSYNEVGNVLGTRIGEDYFHQRGHERFLEEAQVKLAERDASRADREQIIRSASLLITYLFLGVLVAGALYSLKLGHPAYAVILLSPTLLAVFGVIIRQIIGTGSQR